MFDLSAIQTALLVLLAITSVLLILLILLHKGRGGGVADMFGGGVSSTMSSSGVAERNLNPTRYEWRADGAETLAKIMRAREKAGILVQGT